MLSPILIVCDIKKYKPIFIALHDLGIKIEQVLSANVAFKALGAKSYAGVILERDLIHPSEALEQIHQLQPDLPVIVLNGDARAVADRTRDDRELVDNLAMTGDEKEDLILILESLKRLLPELRSQVVAIRDLLFIKTASKKMDEILTLIDLMKDEPSSVLIQGETGTGKEVIARLLHYSGRRHTAPFVAINCAAIPETLLESELFGHERGSFTGATEKRIGKFELANKGTAFLDEIGDMPLNTQAKILRVLETGEIERVGGHETIKVDVRIVAATNKNLLREIDKGNFRQDLYYRINTFTLSLPPLRERREDVLPLARHFLDMQAARRGGPKKRLSRAAEQLLLNHEWPGNVRELRNAMERAIVLAPGNVIGPEIVPEEIRNKTAALRVLGKQAHASSTIDQSLSSIVPLKELEKKAILAALTQLDNNATKAARYLSISKATLFRKLKEYGISRQVSLRT